MSKQPEYFNWSVDKLRRKANQEWELAGLARQDGDKADAAKHTELARLYDQRAADLASS